MPVFQRVPWLAHAPVAVLLFVVVLGFQTKGDAYRAEFGSHPDESAHYVTGLMVHDYIAQGLPGNPMAFAEAYYDYYPKVALGNWPPGFYAMQALWTLMFSTGRASLMVLMAALTCATAVVVYSGVRRELGWRAAVFAALLFTAFGLIQQYASMVMTEIPVALFSTLAMLSFGRWMDRQRARDSILFGLLASLAIMTKGSGFAIALVPPLAILFSGRWNLLARVNLAYAVIIVIVLAGPWTWMFRDVARAGWEQPTITLDYTLRGLAYFPEGLLRSASIIISAFGLIGVGWSLRGLRHRDVTGQWPSAVALIVAVLLFHSLVPASFGYRHLTQALPSWAMLAAAGTLAVHRTLSARQPRLAPFVVVVAAAGMILTAASFPVKYGSGFATVVESIVKQPGNAGARFLIGSDATGEGMFIAETAMREGRPGHIIRRASKLLAAQAWHGGEYSAKVETVDQMIAVLKAAQIRFVVLDESNPATMQTTHTRLLHEGAETRPGELEMVGKYPIVRGYPREVRGRTFPTGIAVYAVR
ncbi:MAG: glycosyltransferase family 39 protein [Vicinamibacterales bacterium]